MAVAYFNDWPGATPDMARGVADRIGAQLGDSPPEGGIFHAEGESDGAWWTFDVWESDDIAQRFYDAIRDPALEAEGVPPSQPRVLSIHWHSLEAPSTAG